MTAEPYYRDDLTTLYAGDCRAVLAGFDAGGFDACVTDPPYGLEFMGQGWDTFGKGGFATGNGYANRSTPSWHSGTWVNKRCRKCGHIASGGSPCRCLDPDWTEERGHNADSKRAFESWCGEWLIEVYRVLKPGGVLMAFGGTRTWHRLACAVEDAGFAIFDTLMWLYGSGFPKHKTLLKPGWEPVILAKKPGRGGLNTEAGRLDGTTLRWAAPRGMGFSGGTDNGRCEALVSSGRWPANVALDEEAAALLDEQSGERGGGFGVRGKGGEVYHSRANRSLDRDTGQVVGYGDTGGASRFYYCAKAPASERPAASDGTRHPTVKPLALMRWLVRMACPPGGRLLDPFAGSGTTLVAAREAGVASVGIDLHERHCEIAVKRFGPVALPLEAVS